MGVASKSLEVLLGRAFDEDGVDPRVLVGRIENLALDLWEALDALPGRGRRRELDSAAHQVRPTDNTKTNRTAHSKSGRETGMDL